MLHYDAPDDELSNLSEVRNADQNQNVLNTEIHLIIQAQRFCIAEEKLAGARQFKIGSIVYKITSNSVVKLNANAVGIVVKLVIQLGIDEFVNELLLFLSRCVNACVLSCSTSWMEEMMGAIPKEMHIMRNAALYLQYDGSVVHERPRPMPDICGTIDSGDATR